MQTARPLTWGILGTGNIAGQFATGLNSSPRHELLAVGSRQPATSREFAAKFKVPHACDSYHALHHHKEIEAVYISLPNSMHHEWTLKALQAGKHVLCEKPLATNLAQAQEMFDTAQRAGKILAEAFMYRSHPLTHAIQKALADGLIGNLKLIRTSFVYPASKIDGNVRFSVPLHGGSLMDIGCYCLSFSRLFAGAEPTSMHAAGHLHETGIDDYAAGHLCFPKDIFATFACGMTIHADNTAHLYGTHGYIEIPIPWKPPVSNAEFTLIDHTGTRHTTKVHAHKHLYALEADEFADTLQSGSPQRVTREESLGNQHCLDTLRKQIGLPF